MNAKTFSQLIVAGGLCIGVASARAEEAEVRLAIHDHRFVPAEISVRAQTKIKLIIENQDATAEEFESYELNREKVVPAKGQVQIYVGPLDPGRYPFFGDFHKESATGVLIAK